MKASLERPENLRTRKIGSFEGRRDSSRAAGNKVRRKSASRAGCVGETHNNNKEPGRSGSTSGR